MTTAWRCAPCQRMRLIQITQWSGSRACNLLAKIEFRCRWLRWREWDCVGALLGCSAADHVTATRAHASQAVSASCHCNQNFCPASGSDTHLQIRRAPRSAATWVDVIQHPRGSLWMLSQANMCLWYGPTLAYPGRQVYIIELLLHYTCTPLVCKLWVEIP